MSLVGGFKYFYRLFMERNISDAELNLCKKKIYSLLHPKESKTENFIYISSF